MLPDALDQYRQPKYTGENRCLPCTAVNVAIAVVFAALFSFVGTPFLGLLVLGGSLLAIYLRGYLVPGTPELTKQYLPDWVLAMFDKQPAGGPRREPEPDLSALDEETDDESESGASVATADDEDAADDEIAETGTADEEAGESDPADPEELLSEMGIVQERADGEDIELTDAFAEDLLDAADALRDDEAARAEAIADLLGAVDDPKIHDEIHGPAFYAGEERIHRWPSEAALLADASAQRALAGREAWETTAPEQRLGIARALRSFIPTCPVCGGAVGLTEETVSSCCRDWDVFAIRCGDCDAHFLELEPGERDEASETIAKESEGARGVSGGFER